MSCQLLILTLSTLENGNMVQILKNGPGPCHLSVESFVTQMIHLLLKWPLKNTRYPSLPVACPLFVPCFFFQLFHISFLPLFIVVLLSYVVTLRIHLKELTAIEKPYNNLNEVGFLRINSFQSWTVGLGVTWTHMIYL